MHGLATDRPCACEACSTGVEAAECRGTGVAWEVLNDMDNIGGLGGQITAHRSGARLDDGGADLARSH